MGTALFQCDEATCLHLMQEPGCFSAPTWEFRRCVSALRLMTGCARSARQCAMPCARFSGTPASSVSQLNAVFSSSKRSRTPYPTVSSLGRGAKSASDSKRQNRPHVEYPIPSGQNVAFGLSVHLSDRPLRSSPSGQNVAPALPWGGRTPGPCRNGGAVARKLSDLCLGGRASRGFGWSPVRALHTFLY